MTQTQVRNVLARNTNAAIYLWHGQTFLDDGVAVRSISPKILCNLNKAGVIAPTDPYDASIWLAK